MLLLTPKEYTEEQMFSCWPHLMVRATAVCSCLLPLASRLFPLAPLATWLSRPLALASFPSPHHHADDHDDRAQTQSQSKSGCVGFGLRFDRKNVAKYKNKSQTHTHTQRYREYAAGNDSYQLCLSLWPATTHKAKPPQKKTKKKRKEKHKTFLSSIKSKLYCS